MRKILYSKYIPVAYDKDGSSFGMLQRQGTGCWGPFEHKGIFHQWGSESSSDGDSVATDTMAIVEMEDGTISLIAPSKIKFVDAIMI